MGTLPRAAFIIARCTATCAKQIGWLRLTAVASRRGRSDLRPKLGNKLEFPESFPTVTLIQVIASKSYKVRKADLSKMLTLPEWQLTTTWRFLFWHSSTAGDTLRRRKRKQKVKLAWSPEVKNRRNDFSIVLNVLTKFYNCIFSPFFNAFWSADPKFWKQLLSLRNFREKFSCRHLIMHKIFTPQFWLFAKSMANSHSVCGTSSQILKFKFKNFHHEAEL